MNAKVLLSTGLSIIVLAVLLTAWGIHDYEQSNVQKGVGFFPFQILSLMLFGAFGVGTGFLIFLIGLIQIIRNRVNNSRIK